MLYHYTKGIHLKKILEDGYLKESTAFIGKNERPAVHLSYSETWEPSVWNDMLGDIQLKAGGKARIGISDELNLVNWREFEKLSRINPLVYKTLTEIAISANSPLGEWRHYFGRIPKNHFLFIEIMNNNRWIRWDGITPIDRFVKQKNNN